MTASRFRLGEKFLYFYVPDLLNQNIPIRQTGLHGQWSQLKSQQKVLNQESQPKVASKVVQPANV
jgi:hypothetical protein